MTNFFPVDIHYFLDVDRDLVKILRKINICPCCWSSVFSTSRLSKDEKKKKKKKKQIPKIV